MPKKNRNDKNLRKTLTNKFKIMPFMDPLPPCAKKKEVVEERGLEGVTLEGVEDEGLDDFLSDVEVEKDERGGKEKDEDERKIEILDDDV